MNTMKTSFICTILIGISIEVITGAVIHHQAEDKPYKNDTVQQNGVPVQMASKPAHSDIPYHVPPAPETSTASKDDGVKVVRREDDSWKNIIIIACTVMASLEIVIVGYMAANWKRIRWHLRKMNCPCCASSDNLGRSQDHQTVEMEERDSLRNNITTTVHSDHEDIVEISIVPPSLETNHRLAQAENTQQQEEQGLSQNHGSGRQRTNSRSSERGRRSHQSDRIECVEAGPSSSSDGAVGGYSDNHFHHVEAQIEISHA